MPGQPPPDIADHAEEFAHRWRDRLKEYCSLRMEALGLPYRIFGFDSDMSEVVQYARKVNDWMKAGGRAQVAGRARERCRAFTAAPRSPSMVGAHGCNDRHDLCGHAGFLAAPLARRGDRTEGRT